jgi:hypothetical protein
VNDNATRASDRLRLIRRYLGRTLAAAALVGGVIGVGNTATAKTNQDELPADQFIAQYADAHFSKRGTGLDVAPGWEWNGQERVEVLEARLHKETCGGGYQIVSDVKATKRAADLEGVHIDALAGHAAVHGRFRFVGTVSIVPAGPGCVAPKKKAAVTTKLVSDVILDVEWRNQRGSTPVVYSGKDCGGDGICYYRDARANGAWSSAFIGDGAGRSRSGYFWQGTYNLTGDETIKRADVHRDMKRASRTAARVGPNSLR